MRHFIWPILLLALGAPDIERAVMENLCRNYPVENAQYVCDLSRLDLSRIPASDSVVVDGFGKDAPRGQMVARLSFFKEHKRVYQTAVSIKVGILRPVLVTSSSIRAEEPITGYKIETRDVASIDETPFERPGQLEGLVASHFIPAGRALVPSALKRPPTMKSGEPVRIDIRAAPSRSMPEEWLAKTAPGATVSRSSMSIREK